MKQPLKVCIACATLLLPVACASRPAPGISGHWQPLNRYASRPQEIPLYPAHEFYAVPLDGTLKGMLARWARDSKLVLDYQNGSDFTLYEPVSRIRTADLRQALAQLSTLYAAQRVNATLIDNAIVVRRKEQAGARGSVPPETITTQHAPSAPAASAAGRK